MKSRYGEVEKRGTRKVLKISQSFSKTTSHIARIVISIFVSRYCYYKFSLTHAMFDVILECQCPVFCKTKRGFPPFFLEPLFGQKTYILSQNRTKPSKSRNFDFPFVRSKWLRFWNRKKWWPCRYKSWFIAGSKLDICNIGSGSKVSLAKMDGFRIAT